MAKLSITGHSVSSDSPKEDYVDITLMALSSGVYTDMDGHTVNVTPQVLNRIKDRYNKEVRSEWENEKMYKGSNVEPIEEFDYRNAPVQLQHVDDNPRETVGHVIGLMDVKHGDDKSYLYMTVRVKGGENVPMVTGKTARWRNVSMQYNQHNYKFKEVSFVVRGADSTARVLLAQAQMPEILEIKNELNVAKNKITRYIHLQEARKMLDAACMRKILTKAQANEITSRLSQFENPKSAVRLAIDCQPKITFNPMFIKKGGLTNGK